MYRGSAAVCGCRHAFRGVSGLRGLRLVDCRLGGDAVGPERFSSLRGLARLHLDGLVGTRRVDAFAFRGTADVDHVLIRFRSDHVTLRADALAHLRDVGTLELRGSASSNTGTGSASSSSSGGGGGGTGSASSSETAGRTGSRAALTLEAGAFRDLVGVARLRVVDFRLPTLRRHSFSGLGRVANLTIADCSVASIEPEAFGDAAGHVGAIGLLDLRVGNQLHCDCSAATASGAPALRRQLARRFSDYRAVCRVDGESAAGATFVDIREVAACTSGASSRRTVSAASSSLSAAAAAVALLSLAVYR